MSGERQGGREAIDRMVKQLKDAGNSTEYATKIATDSARRVVRREDRKKK